MLENVISIHILRVEDDQDGIPVINTGNRFQSTSSVWRMTSQQVRPNTLNNISIHILRVEDDVRPRVIMLENVEISIHILRVEDDTFRLSCSAAYQIISIHILRVEDDENCKVDHRFLPDFNPHPPCGG